MKNTLLILVIEQEEKIRSIVKQCADIDGFATDFFYSDENKTIINELLSRRPNLLLINYENQRAWKGIIDSFNRDGYYLPTILYSQNINSLPGKVTRIDGVWDLLSLRDPGSFRIVLRNFWNFTQSGRNIPKYGNYSNIRELFPDLITKNATEGVLVVQEGYLRYMDFQISNFLGYSDSQLKSTPFLEFVHPDDRDLIIQSYKNRIKGKKVEKYRFRAISNENKEVWIETSGHKIDWEGKPASLNLVTEITDRVIFEKTLKESEAKYRGVVLSSPNGIIVLNQEGIIVDLNPALAEITGYPKDTFLGKRIVDISALDEDAKEKGVQVFREIVSGERTEPEPFEIKFKSKDGERRYVRVNVRLIQDDEEIEGVLVTCIDITEQKKSTENIIRSEKRYRDLHERMLEALVGVDVEGDIVEFNNSFIELTGYSQEDLSNMNVNSLIPVEWESLKLELLEDAKLNSSTTQPYEMDIKNSRNEFIPVEVHCYLNEDSEKPLGYWCFLKDIRSRKKYENELIERDIQTRATLEYLPLPLLQEDLSEVKFRIQKIEDQGIMDFEEYFCENPLELEGCCKNMRIVDCNQAALHFFGASDIQELEEMQIYIQNSALMNTKLKLLLAFKDQERKFEEEVVFESKNGVKREALLRSVILPGKEDSWDTVLITIIDLSERVKQEKRIKVLSQAIRHSPASVVITNTEGIIEYVNPKFSEVTGYSEDEAIGKTPAILKSGKMSAEFYAELWATLISGGEWIGEIQNRKKDGELFWESATISAVKNDQGEVTHFIAIKEDITGKKKNESILLEAKRKAEESDGLKTAFLANMSHEIRTPMNAIVGFSELLRTGDVSGPDRDEYFSIINSSCKSLSNLIDDIIDLARIEAGQIKIVEEACNPAAIMKELSRFFEEEIRKSKKSISLELNLNIPDDLITETDEYRLRQILTNILGNAFKFTQEGMISVGCFLNENDELEFSIKDTGIGIKKEDIYSIFDRFRQLDGSSIRKYEGTGLGLSVSKSLVELMGGKIGVESKLDEGSEFYFTIPYKPIDSFPGSSDLHEDTWKNVFNWEDKIVLVVEDNESNFEFIKAVLSKTNAQLVWADTGTKAIEIFKKTSDIDLVLMDIQIPELDGYEVTKIIKEININTPVIAQTAYAMSQDRDRALSAGCDDYISKPIKPLDLLNLMEKYI